MAHRPIRYPRLYFRLAQCGEPRYAVAARAALSPSALHGIERGLFDPSEEQRARIAAALDASVDDLFAEDVRL